MDTTCIYFSENLYRFEYASKFDPEFVSIILTRGVSVHPSHFIIVLWAGKHIWSERRPQCIVVHTFYLQLSPFTTQLFTKKLYAIGWRVGRTSIRRK